jgi:hypothetical protein
MWDVECEFQTARNKGKIKGRASGTLRYALCALLYAEVRRRQRGNCSSRFTVSQRSQRQRRRQISDMRRFAGLVITAGGVHHVHYVLLVL